ncbi:MAG: DUF4395 domain-containing protein [Microbacteriaceae bacterium]
MSDRQSIDPRGPRVSAGITAVVVLIVIALALGGLFWPAVILFALQGVVFAVGAFAGVQRHPYGVVFRKLIRPRLKPPLELEDPKPPTFAQGVGLFVTVVGLGLSLIAPLALPIAAAAAFVAAFLNSVFDYCLGCQIYLLLVRIKAIRPA